MRGELSHASFFSGVGGTDLGLERAGFRTVSFSEIDPYACAVLTERWPDVPNLGSIVGLADGVRPDSGEPRSGRTVNEPVLESGEWRWDRMVTSGAAAAALWSGGFPCQDLSVAGKRAGFAGERSVLAFSFLALVERHRPRAILLENVPGLLSSNGGRDMARLLGEMVELGYGVAYRVLDAQHFGVPQRRRRVFILGLRSDPNDADGRVAALRAAEVLSVGTRCERHPATGHKAGKGTAERTTVGLDIAGGLTRRYGKGVNTTADDGGIVIGQTPDASGVREADGLAGRPHDCDQVAEPWVTSGAEMIDASGYHRERLSTTTTPTLNGYSQPMTSGVADERAYHQRDRVYGKTAPALDAYDDTPSDAPMVGGSFTEGDDPLLPLGLDSHRYRCCGNGVVAPVAEWIGKRIAEALNA